MVSKGSPGSNQGRKVERPVRSAAAPKSDVVLAMVAKVKREQVAGERRLEGLVDEARSVGCTWSDIARSLGVTRQGAVKKFGRAVTSGR